MKKLTTLLVLGFLLVLALPTPTLAKSKVVKNKSKAGINKPDETGLTPLAKAIKDNKTAEALSLISKGADVNGAYSSDETVLTKALQYRRLEIAKGLIKAGANVNLVNKAQKSPLHIAIL
ncbi:MAG: ankyrin repeat domain-containing protein, partial [Elusimicrobiaceae bacterium]|nr:ankyrin repeat domain-containing protein [Elusimicrobiaceae bacterium]